MVIIGVMGGSKASPRDMEDARELGRRIAREGWVLLNGGRPCGIMEASARGAKEAGGLTLGILPGGPEEGASPYIDLPVFTSMGSARNVINVLSSHVVVACPGNLGTLSEIVLALHAGRPVVLFNHDPGPEVTREAPPGLLARAKTPAEAMDRIREFLARQA